MMTLMVVLFRVFSQFIGLSHYYIAHNVLVIVVVDLFCGSVSLAGLRRTMEDDFLYFTKVWHIADTCKFVGHVNDFENLIYYVMCI